MATTSACPRPIFDIFHSTRSFVHSVVHLMPPRRITARRHLVSLSIRSFATNSWEYLRGKGRLQRGTADVANGWITDALLKISNTPDCTASALRTGWLWPPFAANRTAASHGDQEYPLLNPVPIVRRGPHPFLEHTLELGRPGRLSSSTDPPDGRY